MVDTVASCYKEYRCPNDGKLLFKGLLVEGEIEVKCKECRQLVVVGRGDVDQLLCLKENCQNRVTRV